MFVDKKDSSPVADATHKSTDVSRRSLLRSATMVAGGAAILATAMTTQPAEAGKMTQAAAAYQTGPKAGQRCADCAFFEAPASCKLVDGAISPAGYCKFFVKKS
jgi:hypothetical protein